MMHEVQNAVRSKSRSWRHRSIATWRATLVPVTSHIRASTAATPASVSFTVPFSHGSGIRNDVHASASFIAAVLVAASVVSLPSSARLNWVSTPKVCKPASVDDMAVPALAAVDAPTAPAMPVLPADAPTVATAMVLVANPMSVSVDVVGAFVGLVVGDVLGLEDGDPVGLRDGLFEGDALGL